MLSHINPLAGFIEEVNKLNLYPEITDLNSAYFKFGNYDAATHTPKHSGMFDERLFGSLSNSIRKLIILENEPIQIKNIHSIVIDSAPDAYRKDINRVFSKIQNYLGRKLNKVTQMSFSLNGSLLETITVKDAINAYLAATEQHAQPGPQRTVAELDALTYGNFAEIIRLCFKEIISLLNEYKVLLEKKP